MFEKIAKKALHTINGNRRSYYKRVADIASSAERKTVLEIGSGISVNGAYSYSTRHLFPDSCNFIMTDINPDFGHKVLDITKMTDTNKYDIILCLNVLEHVYDYNLAVKNLHRSLKSGGLLVIAVPFALPLHDEPIDFWRFTEHSLRKMLSRFSDVNIFPQRSRRWPTGYFVVAHKR